MGVKGKALKWFQSYLNERRQQTVVEHTDENGKMQKHFSIPSKVQTGVPQGSILGPILFLIYINDIANYIPGHLLTIFADDTSLLLRNKNLGILELETFLQINMLYQYFADLNLHINSSKTNFIHIMSNQRRQYMNMTGSALPSVMLNDEFIEESSTVEYLRVTLDNSLRWNEQVNKLAGQLSGSIHVLRHISKLNNIQLSKLVYFALVESLIRYSVIFWGNSSKKNLNIIFGLQKKALRCHFKFKAHRILFKSF